MPDRDRGRDRDRDGSEAPERRAPARPALRVVGTRKAASPAKRGTRRTTPAPTSRRRRRRAGPADVQDEIRRLAGRNANRALTQLMAAADADPHDREREALRILRPLRDL